MPKAKKPWWARFMILLLRVGGIAYLILLVIVFFAQRRIMYVPARMDFAGMVKIAATAGFQPWQIDGQSYLGWKKLTPGARGQVLIIHGNAGCAIDRLDYAAALERVEPLDVYILEYPGYGARAGAPSQASLYQAAAEAFGLVDGKKPLYLFAESLGTGVAAHLAGTHPQSVKGMLLIAPYDSMTHVAQNHMPIFPVWLLLKDRYPAAEDLKNYHGPISVLLAGQDEVVPKQFGRKLYDDYAGPKQVLESPEAHHNGLLNQPDEWWRRLLEFWKRSATDGTKLL